MADDDDDAEDEDAVLEAAAALEVAVADDEAGEDDVEVDLKGLASNLKELLGFFLPLQMR